MGGISGTIAVVGWGRENRVYFWRKMSDTLYIVPIHLYWIQTSLAKIIAMYGPDPENCVFLGILMTCGLSTMGDHCLFVYLYFLLHSDLLEGRIYFLFIFVSEISNTVQHTAETL